MGYFTYLFEEDSTANDESKGTVVKSKSTAKTAVDEAIETVKIGGLRSKMQQLRPKEDKSAKSTGSTTDEANLKNATLAETIDVFKKYAVILVKNSRQSLASFFADPLIELLDERIQFTLGSKFVAEEVKEENRKISQFFEECGYRMKPIDCVVNALEVSEYKVFSPKQQFDVMAKEYPLLLDFESRFNLEF